MIRSTSILTILSSILALAILLTLPTPKQTLPPTAITPLRPNIQTPAPVKFEDTSLNWGILPAHTQSSEHLTDLTETLGSGICALDFNKDGWMDLFFVGGSGHNRHYGRKAWWAEDRGNRLLLNVNGQSFKDVTEDVGLNTRIWGMSCTAADFNNDGFTDLLVTGVGSNLLYQNHDGNTFTDITNQSGISHDNWSTGASLGDFNRDGLIDIYISNYILYKKGARTFERTSGFHASTNPAFDPTLYNPEANRLYINKGNFIFEDIAGQAGVSNSLGRSLGARWFDLNHDNWLDLIVINDHNSPNQVFINNKNKTFSRGNEHYAALEVAGAHDLVIDDFDNNGQSDFFMSRSMNHPPILLSPQIPFFENDKIGTHYSDTAWSQGLAQAVLLPFTGWGSTAADFNNDGWQDLYIANGMILPDLDSHFTPQAQQNSLFLNTGSKQFQLEPSTTSSLHPYSSRSAISVDLNNNGKLEIIITNNNDPLQIFENQASNQNKWLGIDLLSHNFASDIYGTKLELITDRLTITRVIQAKQNFLSQGDPRIHLGLGNSSVIKSLVFYWPDGEKTSFENLKPNQYLVINKANNIHPLNFAPPPPQRPLSQLNEAALINLSNVFFHASAKKTYRELLQIWQYATNTVKQYMLSKIEKKWDIFYLPVIKAALKDDVENIVIRAIKILKKSEIENSINWLIPMLDNNNPNIQCAASNAFQFFFKEEEAVTHRKNISIPALVRQLESSSGKVKICAANALASAENKRALLPLLKLSEKTETKDVRIASIRALGLIRDASARKKLIEYAINKKSNAAIVASALIALKRLSEPKIDSIFNTLFSKKDTSSTIKNYHILDFLFENMDGIVFSKQKLTRHLEYLLKTSILKKTPSNDTNIIISALNAIKSGKPPQQLKTIKRYLNHKHIFVRLAALRALVTLNTPTSKKLLERTLLKETFSNNYTFIMNNNLGSLTFSDTYIFELVQKSNKTLTGFKHLMDITPHLSKKSSTNIFNTIQKTNLNKKQKLSLINLCISGKISPNIKNYPLPHTSDIQPKSNTMSYAYANCYFSSHSTTTNLNNKQLLKSRLALNTIMSETTFNNKQKNNLILIAAKNDVIIAKTLLQQKLKSFTPKQQTQALHILETHELTKNTKSLLWATLKDKNKPNELRLQAAAQLMRTDEANILEFIREYFFNS